MDLQLLRLFQSQVVYACRAVILGGQDIRAAHPAEGRREFDDARLWYGIQNVITGAGNLSKVLWGTGRTKQEADERRATRLPLRESLGVEDDSPLRRVKIRNDYEHLDERLEQWWRESTNHNIVGTLIGPRGSVGGDAISDKDIVRWFDPTTGDVIFWGNELNLPSAIAEASALLPIAQAEAAKPHWEAVQK